MSEATTSPAKNVSSSSTPISDAERERVFLEGIENKLNGELTPIRAFMDVIGPAVESLKKSYEDLSQDYRSLAQTQSQMAQDLNRFATNTEIAAASTRDMAEHVGVLIGGLGRLNGRIGSVEEVNKSLLTRVGDVEAGQKTAADATDRELASLRSATSENRARIIEIVKDDPRIATPEEITAIRKMPPVATALEQQLAQLQVERAKGELEAEQQRKKDELARAKQDTIARGKIFRALGQALAVLILGAAMWAAGRYFGFKAGQETMEQRK